VVLVRHANSQQLVPRRMKLNLIHAVAKAIVSVQCGRMTVRQFTQAQGCSASHQRAEFSDRTFGPIATFASHCISQRNVIGKEIVIFERRRLIEDLAGLSVVCHS
jgi:hypothetical protein